MFEGLVSASNINFLLVFFEGLLSFLSPCVLPLIPLYISYLAGNAKEENEDGTITYKRKKVFLHTVFFIAGISFAFFILGITFTALGTFFNSNKMLFSRIGGIIIILLGLVQVGFLDFNFLKRERKLNLKLKPGKMNPLLAFVMGFTFSFAWTPCVGPALSSVLILASSAKSAATGNLLVFVYSLGFVLPFLILGLFTTQALNFIKAKRNIMKYAIKIGGVILIIMGIMTYTGWLNNISGYLNSISGTNNNTISSQENTNNTQEDVDKNSNSVDYNSNSVDYNSEAEGQDENKEQPEENSDVLPAFDFELTDQYGNKHKLSDYKGKTVFLNFWATWCPPCRLEMPDIEAIYKEYNLNKDEVIILGVAQPGGREKNISGIKDFLKENKITYPVVFDETGSTFMNYRISSLPTTFMIDKDGNIFGYVSGALSKGTMKSIISQTIEGKQ